MKTELVNGFNGLKIFTRVYDDVENPKAVIQIIHGMHEHSGRYERFAKMLNQIERRKIGR